MAERNVMTTMNIAPRARKIATENRLSLEALHITGSGYKGGVCAKDILEYLSSHKKVASPLPLGNPRFPSATASQSEHPPRAAEGDPSAHPFLPNRKRYFLLGKIKASPVTKKIAAEKGIDLSTVSGTGIGGKIMKGDVADYVQQASSLGAPAESFASAGKYGKEIMEVVAYTGVRKIIGDRLSASKFTAPHLYFTQKVNLENVLNLRKQVNNAQDKKASVTDFIAKAVIIALQKHPEMNASLVGDTIEKYKSVNLGIAVAAPAGLIVPVVKNAQNKSFLDISIESGALIEKARNGKLTPDEYNGGTFTISNLGMFGIENFTAIINPPELGILAISATKDEPFVVKHDNGEKSVEIKPMMNITLSADHRVIDGLLAAEFVTEIKDILENPLELLLK